MGLAACTGAPPGESPAPEDSGTPSACDLGQVADGDTCVPEACGVGPWGDLPVDDTTVYVSVGGTGDGSADAPLGSVLAAADLAGSRGGGLVAVSVGTYAETLLLGDAHRGVTLAGRCRERVFLDGSDGDDVPVVEIQGDRWRPAIGLEGLTVSGGRTAGIWIENATVSVTRTDLRDNTRFGLVATPADLTLVDVGVYGTVADRRGDYGRGIGIEAASTASLDGCTIQGNMEIGLFVASGGTSVVVADSAFLDTLLPPRGGEAIGVEAQGQAHLTLTGSRIERSQGAGLYVDSESVVTLTDSAIADTTAGDDFGAGVSVLNGASLSAARVSITRTQGVGLSVVWGATADLEDVDVIDVSPGGLSEGRALSVLGEARVTVRGGTLGPADETAVLVGELASAELRDTTIVGSETSPENLGAAVQAGGSLSLVDSTVADVTGYGLGVLGVGTSLVLSGTTVRGTRPVADGSAGAAVVVQQGAGLVATDTSIEDTRMIGMVVRDEGTVADLTDLRVTGTQRGTGVAFALGIAAQGHGTVLLHGGAIADTEGPGVYLVSGASVSVDGTAVTGNQFAGVLVRDAAATLTDCSITGNTGDAEAGGGFGIYAGGADAPSSVDASACVVGPHPYAAVWLAGEGRYVFEGNDLAGSGGVPLGDLLLHGNAVFAQNGVRAWDGESGLLLSDDTLHDAAQVAVLLHGATASLEENTWSTNPIDVWQQACDTTTPLSDPELVGVPTWERCPDTDLLVDFSTTFSTLYLPEITAIE